MTEPRPVSPATAAAIRACYSTRGKHKGFLLKNPPPGGTAQHAAWQALVLAWNPYKASVWAIMCIRRGEHADLFAEALAWAEANMQLRGSDRDRLALERLGVW